MSRRALALALAAALITGSAIGLIGGILLARQWFQPHPMHQMGGRGHGGPPPHERGARGPRGGRRDGPSAEVIARHLREELSLTEAQSARIVELIRTSRERVDGERDSLHTRIGRELTAEQRQRWERMPRPPRFPGPPPGPRED